MFKLNDQQGSALLLTIVVTFVLLFVGSALGLYSLIEISRVHREEADLKAYYLARSGADAIAQWVIENPEDYNKLVGVNSEPVELGDGYFRVQLNEEGNRLNIVSTGTIGSRERKVQLSLKVDSIIPILDQAIFATGIGNSSEPAIQLEGSAKIIGTAGTNSTNPKSIYLDWSTVIEDGDLLIGPGADPNDVVESRRDLQAHMSADRNVTNLTEILTFVSPSFPDEFPNNLSTPIDGKDFQTEWEESLDYRISEDGAYDRIAVTAGRTLKIDLAGGIRTLRVKKFEVGGNIELINLGEKGKLILYIDEVFAMGGNWNVNYNGERINDPSRLTIYYAGNDVFGNAQFNFCGNVVVKDAEIKIGAGSTFIGSVFSQSSKKIIIDGAAVAGQGVIYAPNASVEVSGSAKTGSIIAAKLKANGAAQIVFNEYISYDSFPEDVFGNSSAGGRAYKRELWSSIQ